MADGTLKVGTITTSSGSGTITLGQSGETVSVPSGATLDMSSGTMTLNSSMKNTPSFLAYQSSAQSISNAANTTITLDTEVYDTDSAFASDKFTVPSGKAGKYFFLASWQTSLSTDFNQQAIYFYKNGSQDYLVRGFHDHYGSIQILKTIDLSVGDYIEVYAYQNSGSSLDTENTEIFQGYKIIE
jgi:hypothetical protein